MKQIQFTGSVVPVDTTTLDDLISKHGLPEFIKIDVEGNEKNVLAGLTQAIKFISFEILLPEYLPDAIDCMDILIRLNKNTTFNYATEENLALPGFLPYEPFKQLLLGLSINHLEIIASTQ